MFVTAPPGHLRAARLAAWQVATLADTELPDGWIIDVRDDEEPDDSKCSVAVTARRVDGEQDARRATAALDAAAEEVRS